MNDVYRMSMQEMEETFLLPIPKEKKEKIWSSIQDFSDSVHDILNAPRPGYSTIVTCAILKTMYAVKDILDHHGDLEKVITETDKVIEKIKKLPGFTVIKEDKNTHDIYFHNGFHSEDPRYFSGRLNSRTKRFKSVLLKLIYNRSYFTSTLLKDFIGLRIEIDDPSGTHMGDQAFHYFGEYLFGNQYEAKEKGAFLSSRFIPHNSVKISKAKKALTGDLIEVKIVGKVKNTSSKNMTQDISNSVELQIVYTGNKNNSGFNKHEIYDLKKILSAVSRLVGTLSIGNIKVAIRETLKILEEGNKQEGDKKVRHQLFNRFTEESILSHLLYPNRDGITFLRPMRIQSELRFITEDVYNENFHDLYKNYPHPLEELDAIEFERLYKAARVTYS